MPDVIIVIDSRRPKTIGWELYFTLPTIPCPLDTGDYSIVGCEELICIERKTLGDLISFFTGEQQRFTRELRRSRMIPDRIIICDSHYGDLLRGQYHSKMHPPAAWASAVALMTRYRIPLLMARDAESAEELCQSILLRWFKEHVKVIPTVARAARDLQGCA
ncbi:MAG: ERCC4 domain-containing protein [Desulfomonile sp.]|nr:ERCC4 domain-containing protein [Desulfomonile sp.]